MRTGRHEMSPSSGWLRRRWKLLLPAITVLAIAVVAGLVIAPGPDRGIQTSGRVPAAPPATVGGTGGDVTPRPAPGPPSPGIPTPSGTPPSSSPPAAPSATPTTRAPASPAPKGTKSHRPSPAPTRTANPAEPSGVAMPVGNLPGWKQVLADDFTGHTLDPAWMSYTGQPDGDPGGYFSPSHVSVAGDMLTIGGWREKAHDNIYVTGGVSNREALSQTYGKYEVRFRADMGRGIGYVALLWPSSNNYPPEIDFAEDNGKNRDRLYTTLHPADGSAQQEKSITGDFTKWHTAGLEWTPGKLVYLLDGKVWATLTGDRVPSEPMDLAIQTQAWYCGHNWEACPDGTTPARVNMQVDWAVMYSMAK